MKNNAKWRVAHASFTGTKHRTAGTPCQDYSCFLTMPRLSPDTLVAAVADGLGSASRGADGSRIAAEAACARASHLLWQWRRYPPTPEVLETILYASLLEARQALNRAAQGNPRLLHEHATTLLVLLHLPPYIATAHIGDGAAVISHTPGDYRTIASPQRGEYANETASLTSRRALHQAQLTIARPHHSIAEIAMTTDGLLNLTFDMATLEPHPPFFSKMADWLRNTKSHPHRQLQQLLSTPLLTDRTDDDITILLAVREP